MAYFKEDLQLNKLTFSELFNHEAKAYNSRTWECYCNRYCNTEDIIQIYVAVPDKYYSYHRFFKTYHIEGFTIFSDFNPFSSCLTNNGFTKVTLSEEGAITEVYTEPFSNGKGDVGRANNEWYNRRLFAKNYTQGVYV